MFLSHLFVPRLRNACGNLWEELWKGVVVGKVEGKIGRGGFFEELKSSFLEAIVGFVGLFFPLANRDVF